MNIGLLIIQQENKEQDSVKSELASKIYKKQDFVPILLTSQQGLTHNQEKPYTSFLKQKLLEKRILEYDIIEENLSVDTYSQVVLANYFVEKINPDNIGVIGSERFVNVANKIYPKNRNFIHIPTSTEKNSFKDWLYQQILFFTLHNSWGIKSNDMEKHEWALRTYHPDLGVKPKKDLYQLIKNT